jgi:hypothetical protein
MEQKPKVKLTGQDGNVFNLLGICKRALERANLREESKQLTQRVFNCSSYGETLVIMEEYCEIS